MRKSRTIFCIMLCLILIINLAGFDALAEDSNLSNEAGSAAKSSPAESKKTDQTGGSADDALDSTSGANTDTSSGSGSTSGPASNSGVNTGSGSDNNSGANTDSGSGSLGNADSSSGSDSGNTPGLNPDPGSSGSDPEAGIPNTDGSLTDSPTSDSNDPDNPSSTDSENSAGELPGQMLTLEAPKLTAKAEDGTVSLTWTAVTGAQSYKIYQVSDSGLTLLTDTENTPYTHTVPKNNTTYRYIAGAAAEGAEEALSVEVTAVPRTKKPEKVTNFAGMDGEKKAVLSWSKTTGATGYYVYRYNSSKKRWEMIKQTTKTSYTDKSLKAGSTYKYRVAAFRTNKEETAVGSQTSTLSVSIKKTPGTKVYPMKYKATILSKAPCFSSKNGKKRAGYLAKGTKVTTINSGNGRYKIQLSNGKIYWVAKGRLKITASVWTSKDYSTSRKTNFVNAKGYKSPTKYLIWISQYTQRVMIFKGSKGNWKMIRSCRCATGTYLHKTPKGVFKITYKEKGWFYKTTYEKPIVHFKGANSFHSRIKNYKGGYADATIGKPRSKGCVRLYDEDINFIYKQCPKGTTVVSF